MSVANSKHKWANDALGKLRVYMCRKILTSVYINYVNEIKRTNITLKLFWYATIIYINIPWKVQY